MLLLRCCCASAAHGHRVCQSLCVPSLAGVVPLFVLFIPHIRVPFCWPGRNLLSPPPPLPLSLLQLPESSLETVVPKHEGAAVLVVGGPHRGARGRLLQCNTAAGAAAVQLAADFSIQRLLLDHVAAYVGEMEED